MASKDRKEPADAPIYGLAAAWRAKAAELEPYSPPAAHAFSECADALEVALQQSLDESLKIREAARMSGFSESYLGRLVREGTIPNVGRPHAPRIRRRDLPRKPGRAGQNT